MLTNRVAVAQGAHVAGELSRWPSIKPADEERRRCLTLLTVAGHEINFLIVHDNGSRHAVISDRQAINLEPVVSHCVVRFAPSRALSLARLSSRGEDESIVHQRQWNLKSRRLKLVLLHSLEILIYLDTLS